MGYLPTKHDRGCTLKDWLLKILYFIICPLVFISYLLEPLFGDIHIYLGAAKVTALTPGFPMSLDTIWETRFIGHRFFYYVLNLVSPFEDPFYSIWIKLLVAIPTILILYYFSKQVSEHMQISVHYPFTIGFLGLFAVNNFVILSTESVSIVIAMLMTAMLLDTRRWLWFASGLLILPLVTMKGLPVLLVPIVILSIIMLIPDYKNRISIAAYSLPVIVLLWAALALYFPHFISDIFLVGKLYHIGQFDPFQMLSRFLERGISVIGYIPIIVIGVFTLFELVTITNKKMVRTLKLLLGMWGISSAYVFIIAEFFDYHYYLMLIPTIFTICCFLKEYIHHKHVFTIIVVSVLILFVSFVSGWSLGLSGATYNYQASREKTADEINNKFDVMAQPVTLYYDEGFGAYYFPTQSACRFVGPFPYQRHMPNWDMRQSPEYWETLNCTMSYTGKYVIINPTFITLNETTHSELATKLNTGYIKVYDKFWDIYQRRT
jgi:hypothetical protein